MVILLLVFQKFTLLALMAAASFLFFFRRIKDIILAGTIMTEKRH
jgi:hypothetical protein